MTELKALLIEFDLHTGKRAGNLKIDAGVKCHGWQNIDVTPALEIRLISDNRDTKQYENIPGITILDGKEAINKAIDDNIKSKYKINHPILYEVSFKSKTIDLDNLSDNDQEKLKQLKEDHGVKGITVINPMKV